MAVTPRRSRLVSRLQPSSSFSHFRNICQPQNHRILLLHFPASGGKGVRGGSLASRQQYCNQMDPQSTKKMRSSSGRRRRNASCLLTTAAAAALAALPSSTDAFVSPPGSAAAAVPAASSSRRCGDIGPLHAHSTLSLPPSTSPLCLSASSLLDVRAGSRSRSCSNNDNRILCYTSFDQQTAVGSTVVPSTAFLSSRQCPTVISIPGIATKYGGRSTAGSTAGLVEQSGDDVLILGGTCRNRNRGTLGFVVVDDCSASRTTVPGAIVGSRTRLAVSRSSTAGQSPSLDELDPSSFFESGAGPPFDISSPSSSRSKSRSSRNGGSAVDAAGDIRTIEADSPSTSPVKRHVAASLRRNSSAGSDGSGSGDGGTRSAADSLARPSASSSADAVPGWFPWVPTRAQIEKLKVPELRAACAERDLSKAGRKMELQERLMGWTTEQHRQRVENRRSGTPTGIIGSTSSRKHSPLDGVIDDALLKPSDSPKSSFLSSSSSSSTTASTSSVEGGDIESLFNRRKALRQAKDAKEMPPVLENDVDDDEDEEDGIDNVNDDEDDLTPTQEYLSSLAETFNSPTAKFSNYEVQEMYKKAKLADKAGNRWQAKKILVELLEATPKDTRILRRLSRMNVEEGNISGARQILQNGIRRSPGDADLLHGLATLEAKHGSVDAARVLYKEAIRADPNKPNAYHALGTMEHLRGNIRVATAVLRHGIKNVRTNHRLHHALGDLYREAQMFDLSELAYRKALKHCSEKSGRSFVYTALAYLSYDKGNRSECRRWLQESLEVNNGLHSQGWLGLAQLEESEGRLVVARSLYDEALGKYEKMRSKRKRSKSFRPSLSGDKWIFVYRSWARMEEEHGTYESANAVYARATKMFPNNSLLYLGWAKLNAKHGLDEKARSLFNIACKKGGSRSAETFRVYAEFEIDNGDYGAAKSILFRASQLLLESPDTTIKSDQLALLFHTWALCEWHLQNHDRTEKLFDHALRMTDPGDKGSELRSIILYSLARFFFTAKKEHVLAQHSVCLALKENDSPGLYPHLFKLWASIAEAQGDEKLALRCHQQLGSDASSLPIMAVPAMQLLRQSPWRCKLAGANPRSGDTLIDDIAYPNSNSETEFAPEI